MSVQGATPFTANARQVGQATVPVRPTRTQSLQPGSTVLHHQRKCTVLLPPERNADGRSWRVTLQSPDGATKVVSKPAGFSWAVLHPTESSEQ